MHPVDTSIHLLAQDQHGTFGHRQAYGLGASRQFLDSRVRDGFYVRFAEGSFGLPGWPASYERSLWAALHAACEQALLGGRSAAAIYGFAGIPRNTFELLVPHGKRNRNPIAIVHQTRNMPAAVRLNGFPIPSRERVLCEIARQVGPTRLGIAIDDQLAKKVVSLARVQRTFLALSTPGWPGLAAMRDALATRGSEYVPPTTVLERGLRLVVGTIPNITVYFEKQIGDAVEMPHRVDCVVEEPKKLILEADGRVWHQRMREMAIDRRDRRAAALGYPTFRYLYTEIMHERDVVRAEIMNYLFG